jgi:hypothetical protein
VLVFSLHRVKILAGWVGQVVPSGHKTGSDLPNFGGGGGGNPHHGHGRVESAAARREFPGKLYGIQCTGNLRWKAVSRFFLRGVWFPHPPPPRPWGRENPQITAH